MKVFLEYVWLDGYEPQHIRSKTKVVSMPYTYDDWSFDGSSTKQAEAGKGKNTDCVLKPVFNVKDPFRGDPHRLVFCEVFNPDGKTPHQTNQRVKLREVLESLKLTDTPNFKSKESRWFNELPWFGWEQEYTLTYKHSSQPFSDGDGLPLGFGFDSDNTVIVQPRPQGEYYCGVGSKNVIGRMIVEEHLEKCVEIGLDISGINAEVMLGQWEYQIGPVTALNGSDQLWISRYLLHRVAEKHNVNVSFHPKPMRGDWNGSGCHVNFSNKETREDGGLEHIINYMDKLARFQKEHIDVYGLFNDERMTGEHETSGINDFSYGYSTRDTSIRIPVQTQNEGKGYFEDRRPASNCDPYIVANRMLETVYNTVAVATVQ